MRPTEDNNSIVGQLSTGRTGILTINLAGALCLSLAQKYEKRVTYNIQSCPPDWLNPNPSLLLQFGPLDPEVLRACEFNILRCLGFRVRSTETILCPEGWEPLSPYETLLRAFDSLDFL